MSTEILRVDAACVTRNLLAKYFTDIGALTPVENGSVIGIGLDIVPTVLGCSSFFPKHHRTSGRPTAGCQIVTRLPFKQTGRLPSIDIHHSVANR